jgi:hypothetical protein
MLNPESPSSDSEIASRRTSVLNDIFDERRRIVWGMVSLRVMEVIMNKHNDRFMVPLGRYRPLDMIENRR